MSAPLASASVWRLLFLASARAAAVLFFIYDLSYNARSSHITPAIISRGAHRTRTSPRGVALGATPRTSPTHRTLLFSLSLSLSALSLSLSSPVFTARVSARRVSLSLCHSRPHPTSHSACAQTRAHAHGRKSSHTKTNNKTKSLRVGQDTFQTHTRRGHASTKHLGAPRRDTQHTDTHERASQS